MLALKSNDFSEHIFIKVSRSVESGEGKIIGENFLFTKTKASGIHNLFILIIKIELINIFKEKRKKNLDILIIVFEH
jgi:hypothetical protein